VCVCACLHVFVLACMCLCLPACVCACMCVCPNLCVAPPSGRRKTSNPSSLQDSSLPEESLVKRKGYSDSESIGGSLESLSSPGKHVCFIWQI
jgi:hypothetical protein